MPKFWLAWACCALLAAAGCAEQERELSPAARKVRDFVNARLDAATAGWAKLANAGQAPGLQAALGQADQAAAGQANPYLHAMILLGANGEMVEARVYEGRDHGGRPKQLAKRRYSAYGKMKGPRHGSGTRAFCLYTPDGALLAACRRLKGGPEPAGEACVVIPRWTMAAAEALSEQEFTAIDFDR